MVLEEYLDYNEMIKWRGKPAQGFLLRSEDLFLVPFSLLWGGFALFWTAGVFFNDAPPMFLIFGLAFSIMGLHLIFGRFFLDAFLRAYTEYIVTDKRVIITNSSFFVNSFDYLPITPSLAIKVSGAKRGTIEFNAHNSSASEWSFLPFPWQGGDQNFIFERIKNVKEVYELIRSIQNST